jgi:hypothetical protein
MLTSRTFRGSQGRCMANKGVESKTDLTATLSFKSIQVGEQTIQEASELKIMTSLCHLILLKKFSTNGHIHKPKLKKLARILGISNSNCSHHLQIWLQQKWIKYEYTKEGNKFLSIASFKQKHKSTVTINDDETTLSIKAKLQVKIMEMKARQCNLFHELNAERRILKTQQDRYIKKKTYKKIQKLRKADCYQKELQFSNSYFAKELNVSERNFATIKKRLQKLKIIEFYAPVVRLFDMTIQQWRIEKENILKKWRGVYYSMDGVVKQEATRYYFLLYPVKNTIQ